MSERPFKARIFSEEEKALARRMFEKEGATIAAIAAELNVAPATLSKRIRLWRLRRKAKPAKPRALRSAVAKSDVTNAGPIDLRRTAARLEKRIAREIVALEEKLDGAGETERDARTLASLVKSLGELRRFASGLAGEPVDRNAELDDLRAELARRLAQLAPCDADAGPAADPAEAAAG